jgi:hypothetical protein
LFGSSSAKEDGGELFLRNVSWHPRVCSELYPTTQLFSIRTCARSPWLQLYSHYHQYRCNTKTPITISDSSLQIFELRILSKQENSVLEGCSTEPWDCVSLANHKQLLVWHQFLKCL